jgi:hypothetical protein
MSVALLIFMTAVIVAAVLSALNARARTKENNELADQVARVTARLEAAERNAQAAFTQCQVSANVLIEKGLADEEDFERMQRRFEAATAEDPKQVPTGDGTVH